MITECSTGNIPPGYKQTEVGVIPEDWEVLTLGDVIEYIKGFAFSADDYQLHGIRIIRVSDTTYDGIKEEEGIYIDETKAKNFRKWSLREGDLIVSTVGSKPPMYDSMVGKATFVQAKDRGALLNQNAVILRSRKWSMGSQRLLHNHLKQKRYLAHIEKIFRGNANQASITLKELFEYLIPFPPTKVEQEAIAEALSDTDALIESLEQLIAKKRQIKQGAMQELLTGKRRLPGFSGEWEVKQFGEIVQPRKERIDPRRTAVQEFCIELEHIEQGTGCLVGCTATEESSSLKSVFQKDDVLFGKLRAYLRKYWLADREGVCSTEIWVLIAKRSLLTPHFLFQLVQVDRFVEIASLAYGTHMPRSDWNVVKNYEVYLPPLEEQETIAIILSDMDSEIITLEEKLAKARQIKQGMMQKLLTGKIRLI